MKQVYYADARCRETNDGTITLKALLRMLFAQKRRCNICAEDISDTWSVDHKIPLSRMGAHTITNIQLLCWPCNFRKRVDLPEHVSRFNRTRIGDNTLSMGEPFDPDDTSPKPWRRNTHSPPRVHSSAREIL